MKNLIKKIIKEEINDFEWAKESIETIDGKDLENFIRGNNLTEIPDHIKHIDGDLYLNDTPIESLGNLESVSGYFIFIWNPN